MTLYGQIKSYDSGKGSGSIAPEAGGEVLEFGKSDLQQEASMPRSGQRYSYDTEQAGGGENRAVNLRQQEQGHAEQQVSQPRQQQA